MKRAIDAFGPAHDELALVVPVPAQGTVIVMRLEDALSLSPQTSAQTAELKVTPMRGRGRDRRVLRSLEQQILTWLRGDGPADTYLADTCRDGDGSVLATTTEALVRACCGGVEYAQTDEVQRRALIGIILSRLGWSRRYVQNKERVRQRRYFAPPGWQA